MAKMDPPIKDLLPSLTPILKNRHEKVQENCIDLVGRIADRGYEFVTPKEWMRICFELLDMLKAHKKGKQDLHLFRSFLFPFPSGMKEFVLPSFFLLLRQHVPFTSLAKIPNWLPSWWFVLPPHVKCFFLVLSPRQVTCSFHFFFTFPTFEDSILIVIV